MVRRRSNKPKAVIARDRQFWSWAKISLPRDQKEDVISRLMDRLHAEGLLSMDMRPARVQVQVDETIARQIELMPAAFRALHARRGAEMRRRFRLMVTARKRNYLAAKRGSPRRGGASQRAGHARGRGRGAHRAAQQQQQQQQQQLQQEEVASQQEESQQQEDEQMEEEEQEFSQARSVPWSSDDSSEDDASPREPLSPVMDSSTPEEPGPMDVDGPAPAPQTPHSIPVIELLPPNYDTPRSPIDRSSSPASPASPPSVSPPPLQEPTGPSVLPDEIPCTQPEALSAEVRSALRSGQLLEPYEPGQSRSPAPEPETPARQREEDEESWISTEPASSQEDAMRKNLVMDENYDDTSDETSGGAPEKSQIEETPPREADHSSGDVPEEHPEEHPEVEESGEEESEEEESEEQHPEEEHPEEGHPEEEHPEEEHPEEEHPEEEHPEEEHPEEEHPEGGQSQKAKSQEQPEDDLEDYTSDDYEAEKQLHPAEKHLQAKQSQVADSQDSPEDDLEDYTSDDYEAEKKRYPVTPHSQAQPSQGQSSPEEYTQDSFAHYRQSGMDSPSSGSTTEKATSSEASQDEGAPPPQEPTTLSSSFLRDATIFAYASESAIDDMTEFNIHQLSTLVPHPPPDGRVPIDSIRFDLFQELLRPLNFNPRRHEVCYFNVSVRGRGTTVVHATRGLVGAMLVMQIRNSPIEFFLREKYPITL